MDQKLFLNTISNLPSPPAVLRKIAEITADPQISAIQMEQALQLDPAISGKVLKLANSAYIGIPRTVSSLHHAVVLLGNRRIQSLILGSTLLGVARNHGVRSFSLTDFWRHSIITAMIAESIARHLKRYSTIDEHGVFSGAVLHDIGKLVLEVGLPGFIKEVHQKALDQNKTFFDAEDKSCNHSIAGDYIAGQWNFPPDLREYILNHHQPSRGGDYSINVVIVHISDIITHVLGYPLFENEVAPAISQSVLASINLPIERLKVIAAAVLQDQKRVEALLEVFE
ncbi:MAG TPA: HDOD domain-containing protein [Chitinispirillaceae bacterium]|nr:HDOD domain-containing protein [Chitinispirillaceae bacterium]